MTPTETERRRQATEKVIRRIAALEIARFGLTCTVDEYIARTISQTEAKPKKVTK